MSYEYWIIRFVPNVARGEFSNIGIVCGRNGGDWAVQFDLRSIRSHGNFGSDLKELSAWVAWFRRAIDLSRDSTSREMTSGWLEHLRARQANSVQFSLPSPIDVGSAEEGVALLYPHLVERAVPRRPQGLTRRRMRVQVRDILEYESDLTLGRDLFLGPTCQIGRQRGEFDFLRRASGDKSLTNVWAFNVATLDVLERDIQSWNYLVGRLRNDGARLNLGGSAKPVDTIEVAPNSPIDVVYDPPTSLRDGRRTDIFEAALEAWAIADVSARSLTDFQSSASTAHLT